MASIRKSRVLGCRRCGHPDEEEGLMNLEVRSQQYRSGRKSGRCEKSSQKVTMETVACRASCARALAASDSTRPAASARALECTVGAPRPDAAARPAESVSDWGRPRLCGGYVTLAGEPQVRCGRSLCVRQVPRAPLQAALHAGGKPQMAHMFTGRRIIQKNSAQKTELIFPLSCEKS